MLPASCKLLALSLVLTLCSIVIGGADVSAQQIPSENSTQSPRPFPAYLPSRANNSSLLPVILYYLGEPSLLEAAKDRTAVSFRVSYFSPVPVNETAVRLVVDADGGGKILTAVSLGARTGAKVNRTKNDVSAVDVDRFLQFAEKAGFWSTGNTETERNTNGAAGTAYVLDGSWWMLEGVRNGSFHYIYRRNPKPSRITEIGCYLAKNLVAPPIQMPGCR